MGKICFYQQDGRVHDEQELTQESLYDAMGMMARCFLRDGSQHDGFVCFTPGIDIESHTKGDGSTFFLWTWTHLDDNKHRLVGDDRSKYDQSYEPINFLEVERVDAILYSNPRWGGLLYNHFFIDTRPYLGLDDVRHVFKSVWCSGHEEYWYQNAWNILQKHKMTRYSNERERCKVLLRAVAISMVYEDFCNVYSDELPSYDYGDELYDDIPEFVLGQLYGSEYPDEIIESPSSAIFTLANALRTEVVRDLKSEMTDMDILAYLICTVQTLTTVDEDGNEVDLVIEDFGDYVKATKQYQELFMDSPSQDEQRVFSWIADQMPRMSSYE